MKVAELQSVVSAFAEIKGRAQAHWQESWGGGQPVVLVGTATCGRAAGSLEVLKAIKAEAEKQKLDLEVIEVGCMGHCYAEPIVIIAKPGYPPVC